MGSRLDGVIVFEDVQCEIVSWVARFGKVSDRGQGQKKKPL